MLTIATVVPANATPGIVLELSGRAALFFKKRSSNKSFSKMGVQEKQQDMKCKTKTKTKENAISINTQCKKKQKKKRRSSGITPHLVLLLENIPQLYKKNSVRIAL